MNTENYSLLYEIFGYDCTKTPEPTVKIEVISRDAIHKDMLSPQKVSSENPEDSLHEIIVSAANVLAIMKHGKEYEIKQRDEIIRDTIAKHFLK